ncbi:MAG: GxGYxYP family putative glycoside hydrolase, partial [Limnochordia bacterium]|nr:GxGYxYP family putative glycoside hydrolase [Limnochordia bacterium]
MRIKVAVVILVLLLSGICYANDGLLLWQIGEFDDSSAELALGPNRFGEFPGFFPEGPRFVIGQSDPATDWPYIHPGAGDAWANSQEWAFTIVFDAKDVPEGQTVLWIDLVGAHPQAPPGLKISLNGEQLGVVLPEPGNNAPVYVDPAGGKEEIIAIVLPSDKLKTTGNQLTIKTQGGSWVVYDGIKMVSFRGNVPEGFLPVEEDPWAGITPVIKPGMVVVTPAPTTMGEQAMLVSLQGLVNQRVGRLYLGAVTDHWFQQAVPLNQMPVQVKSPLKVLEAFKQEVQGLVIYDPALIDTVNIAFTLAGLNQAIVVSPDLADELLARWDDLTIVADLQDRWLTRLEAYTW